MTKIKKIAILLAMAVITGISPTLQAQETTEAYELRLEGISDIEQDRFRYIEENLNKLNATELKRVSDQIEDFKNHDHHAHDIDVKALQLKLKRALLSNRYFEENPTIQASYHRLKTATTPSTLCQSGMDDFENGSLAGFQVFHRNQSSQGFGCNGIPQDVSTTFTDGVGSLVSITDLGDFDGVITNLPVTNGGSSHAVRINDVAATTINDPNEGRQQLALRRPFTVSNNGNTTVSFSMAVVLRNFHNNANLDAFAYVRILDANFATVTDLCLDITSPGAWNNYQFAQSVNFRWLDWTDFQLDFPASAGNTYYLEFISSDCVVFADEGHAYIDDICVEQCVCGNWNQSTFQYNSSNLPFIYSGPFQNNDVIGYGSGNNFDVGSTLTFTYDYDCDITNAACEVEYLFNSTVNGLNPTFSGGNLVLSFTPGLADIGTQSITVTPVCGKDTCDPITVYFDISCGGCGSWTSAGVSQPSDPSWGQYFSNGQTLSDGLEIGENYLFEYTYNCNLAICLPNFTYSTTLSGGVSFAQSPSNGFSLNVIPSAADAGQTHSITIYPECGEEACPPIVIYFEIECGSCDAYQSVELTYLGSQPISNLVTFNNGGTWSVNEGQPMQIKVDYNCLGGSCTADFDYYSDFSPLSPMSVSSNSNGDFILDFTPSAWDAGSTKCIWITPACLGEDCETFKLCFEVKGRGQCVRVMNKKVNCCNTYNSTNCISFQLENLSNTAPSLDPVTHVEFEFPAGVNFTALSTPNNSGAPMVPAAYECTVTGNPVLYRTLNSSGFLGPIAIGDITGDFSFEINNPVPQTLKVVAKTYSFAGCDMVNNSIIYKGVCSRDTLYFDLRECPFGPRKRGISTDANDHEHMGRLSSIKTNWSVYPNPSNGIFTLKLNEIATVNTEAKVFDSSGKFVKIVTLKALETEIDLSTLAPGLYTITMKNGDQVESNKIQIVN